MRLANFAVRVVLAVWAAAFLAWAALHVFIVPRIDDYRELLQQQASRAVGMRVQIGSIRAQGGWLVPAFEINEVQLFDAQDREALRLPRVLAAISPRSVLRRQFEQLVVEQPELDVHRDDQGHIWVAGLDASAAGDGGAADWFFAQPEFVVRQGVVHWRDESRHGAEGPRLSLTQVDGVMNNAWYHHQLRIDVTPPSDFGHRFTLQGQFQQTPWRRKGDVQHWTGELFVDLPHVDVSSLRQWLTLDSGASMQEGRGAVRAWMDIVQGRPVGVTADVALDAVGVHLDADLKPLNLRHIRGRLGGHWQDDEVEVSSQDLMFETQDGEQWPGGVLRVNWRGNNFNSGGVTADRLDLEALAQISQRLPLPDTLRTSLAGWQPKGQVNQLKANWLISHDAQGKAQPQFTVHGAVKQLHWVHDPSLTHALANLPGVQGADITFDFNEHSGKAQVHVHNGSLTLPLGLDDPTVRLDEAMAQVAWQLKGDEIGVQLTQGSVQNADLAGEFNGSWKTGTGAARLPGVLDLTGALSRANVAQVHRYLPNVLPAEVRDYLRDAVKAGNASKVKLRLRGDLNDMPFTDPKRGEFRITAQIAQGRFAYVPSVTPAKGAVSAPAWPAMTELNGELVFERSAMHFKGSSQLEGAPHLTWQKLEAHVANLAQAEVQLSGESRGSVPELLSVISHSALNDLTGKVLEKSQANGNADFKLALTLPLNRLTQSKVQGSVNFIDNDLQVMPGTPVLKRTRGLLQFSEQGLQLKAMQARLLGGEAQLDGGLSFDASKAESPLQLKIKGNLTAEGLRQAREFGFASRLAERATGSTAYAVNLGLRRGQPELLITSDLKGMSLALPAPLNKVATTVLPLRIETQLTREALVPKTKVLQDQIKITLGRLVAATYVRDLSGPNTRVLRGGIAVGAAVADGTVLRDAGVSLNLQLPMVDLDAWNETLTQFTGAPLVKTQTKGKPVKAQVVPLGLEASAEDGQDYVPTFLVLRADQIKVTERVIHRVLVGGSRQGDVWRLNVSADELNGSAEIRPGNDSAPAQLFARLSYLNIPPSLVPDVESMLTEQPSSIPTLDIVVNELTLRGKRFGRLEIDAINRTGTQATREWRLNKFNITLPEATLTASGAWAADGPRTRRTQLNFVMEVRDSGQLLNRLGTPNAVREGHGRLEGQVSWAGSPITLDYASMGGKLNLSIEKGQFLKTDPGAARLLGVLNLQALPRRLSLDFSDLFSEGFAFDFVRGDVRIEQGVAITNNLQMKGVVAGALIEGRADLARETQDLKVVVVPEINAGTASLYMATINPLVGLTSYLAQLILSKPLVRAGTSEFHVDGTWANPKVTKVD
jgi:uncharacterized protein (TIGR02099 family)